MSIEVVPLEIADVKIVKAKKFGDRRGFFSEVYNKQVFSAHGIDGEYVQDNHSLSGEKGTLRGLHFQSPPFAQHKLVRVVRGSIFDVAVDLRRNSPTYGRHVSAIISSEQWNQIMVPIGFAHGFMTLEPDTEVLYKVNAYYSPEHDNGIIWSDADLAIAWPLSPTVLSDKDQKQPRLSELVSPFE